jgi:hypothetical protein
MLKEVSGLMAFILGLTAATPCFADIVSTAAGYDKPIIHFEPVPDSGGAAYVIERCSLDYKNCDPDNSFAGIPWEKASLLNESARKQNERNEQLWIRFGIAVPAFVAGGLLIMTAVPEEALGTIGTTAAAGATGAVEDAEEVPAMARLLKFGSGIVNRVGGKPLKVIEFRLTNFIKGDFKTVIWAASGVGTAAWAGVNQFNFGADNTTDAVVLGNHAAYFFNEKSITGCVVSLNSPDDLSGWMDATLKTFPNNNKAVSNESSTKERTPLCHPSQLSQKISFWH